MAVVVDTLSVCKNAYYRCK